MNLCKPFRHTEVWRIALTRGHITYYYYFKIYVMVLGCTDELSVAGNIRPAVEIMANLKYILDEPSPQSEYPLGVLTSENRDVWTAVRSQLVDAGM